MTQTLPHPRRRSLAHGALLAATSVLAVISLSAKPASDPQLATHPATAVDPPSWLTEEAFVRAISTLAIGERIRTGVPASITAAQAILESGWGRNHLATTGNNYFGIKCKSYWTGPTVKHKDDDRDRHGRLIESCFRAYDSVEDSFRDHSDFLRGSERYAKLFLHDVTDYRAWAHGLRRCGYATDKAYGEKLIDLIERHHLYTLDWDEVARQQTWLAEESEAVDVFGG